LISENERVASSDEQLSGFSPGDPRHDLAQPCRVALLGAIYGPNRSIEI
jgi:hypothetical protein